ncbi:MAG: histidinol-phosphatase, partial [Pseudomonadota bacterium]
AFGFSDHYILHPRGTPPNWSLPVERVGAYAEEVLSFRDQEDISVLLGLEVDWFEDHGDAIKEALKELPLDFIIGGVHFVGDMPVDSRPEDWEGLTREEINQAYRGYWRLVRGMVESRIFQIAAHLDLPKKFGILPSEDMTPMIHEVLDAMAVSGMVLELNTSGWYRPCRECYPSPDILREALKRHIPVMPASDAHHPDHLLRAFGRAAMLLRDLGYTRIAQVNRGKIVMVPLEDAMDLPRDL